MRGTVLRFAAGRPHVLLVDVPGATRTRLAVERELRRRGWPPATSPADTDLMVVTGSVGDRLRPFRDRLWQQVPGPAVRVPLAGADDVAGALDAASARLVSGGDQTGSRVDDQDRDGADEGEESHQMEMPGGLAMADRGPDRDGLKLDQLHVPLGPFLPDWPAGLVVHTTLQGDVIQEARTEVLAADGPGEAFWAEPWRRAAAGEAVAAGDAARRGAATHLDSLGRLLAVAGWDDAALRARWLRDDVLAGARAEQVMPRLRRFARRLRGSRTLRWLTDRLGVLPFADADAAGVVGPALRASRSGGDVSARWQAWLAEVEQTLPELDETGPLRGNDEAGEDGPTQAPLGDADSNAALLAVLPGLLHGVELATARLIIASLDPDLTELGAPKITKATDG